MKLISPLFFLITCLCFWVAYKNPQPNGDWHDAMKNWGYCFSVITVFAFLMDWLFPED